MSTSGHGSLLGITLVGALFLAGCSRTSDRRSGAIDDAEGNPLPSGSDIAMAPRSPPRHDALCFRDPDGGDRVSVEYAARPDLHFRGNYEYSVFIAHGWARYLAFAGTGTDHFRPEDITCRRLASGRILVFYGELGEGVFEVAPGQVVSVATGARIGEALRVLDSDGRVREAYAFIAGSSQFPPEARNAARRALSGASGTRPD